MSVASMTSDSAHIGVPQANASDGASAPAPMSALSAARSPRHLAAARARAEALHRAKLARTHERLRGEGEADTERVETERPDVSPSDAVANEFAPQSTTPLQSIHILPPLLELVEQGWGLVVSHGNGPQVGFILRRSEIAQSEVDPVPVDYAVADTQGAIGYMFVKALHNEMIRRGISRPVVAVVTQSVVDRDDPAFANPTKPVGSFMPEETARTMAAEHGWTITEDAGRGWRRTVPSPVPTAILETDSIRQLLAAGAIVVAAGGGGIPVVVEADGTVSGLEAVVDKDLASGLLAHELGADLLLIPTAVSRVAVGFGTPGEKWLDRLTVAEARNLIAAGEFGKGSMEPKVAAVADFVERTPHAAGVIGSAAEIAQILDGTSGTRIVADPGPAGKTQICKHVSKALHDAVFRTSWSSNKNALKLVYLVGDAPPHMDYAQDTKYPKTLAVAKQRDIVVNAVLAGSARDTERASQQFAEEAASEAARDDAEGGLDYNELYDSLNALSKEQLGLFKGYRFTLEIERANGIDELREVARHFVLEVRKAKGESAAQMVRRALGLSS